MLLIACFISATLGFLACAMFTSGKVAALDGTIAANNAVFDKRLAEKDRAIDALRKAMWNCRCGSNEAKVLALKPAA